MTPPTRRTFLQSTVFGAAALAVAADAPKIAAVDAHVHFYDPTRPQGVPWPGKDDKLLYRKVAPADLKEATKGLGVVGAVAVEASPWVEDNQWLLDLANRDPFVVAVVGNLPPGEDRFAETLKRFAKDPLFRGIRVNEQPLKRGLEQPPFLKHLQLLVDNDLALDVNGGPTVLPVVVALAKRLPDLRIVLNHEANVVIDGREPPADWREGVKALREHRNVFCKASALLDGTCRADGQAPKDLTFYRPVLDALWASFGDRRLMFGSNWPVSERFGGYAGLWAVVTEFIGDQGKEAAERFFAETARTAYKWGRRPSE